MTSRHQSSVTTYSIDDLPQRDFLDLTYRPALYLFGPGLCRDSGHDLCHDLFPCPYLFLGRDGDNLLNRDFYQQICFYNDPSTVLSTFLTSLDHLAICHHLQLSSCHVFVDLMSDLVVDLGLCRRNLVSAEFISTTSSQLEAVASHTSRLRLLLLILVRPSKRSSSRQRLLVALDAGERDRERYRAMPARSRILYLKHLI